MSKCILALLLLHLSLSDPPEQPDDKGSLFEKNSLMISLQKRAPYQLWNQNMCNKVVSLFQTTGQAIQKINSEIRKQNRSASEQGGLEIKAMKLLSEELVESETWIFSALQMLKETVRSSNSFNLGNVISNSKDRLEKLQIATMKEEQKVEELSSILDQLKAIDDHINVNSSLIDGLIEGVLAEVGNAADQLELSLNDDPEVPIEARNLETVKKIITSGDFSSSLQDVHGNRYIISQPSDKTIPITDPNLLHAVLLIFLFSGFLGSLCHWLWIPSIFGYIICGMLLGPSYMNVIINPVQVETLGEFGVFLMLFCCGLEFSPRSLTKVWRISIGGSLSILLVMIVTFTGLGLMVKIPISHCVFVATCLSFSSTALIIKFLQDDNDEDVNALRDSMLGLLVLQDIQLSVFIGLLPVLSGTRTEHTKAHNKSWSEITENISLGFITICILLVGLFSFTVYKFGKRLQVAQIFNRTVTKEMKTLLPLSCCYTIICLLYKLGISMEVSAFIAGIIVKSSYDVDVHKFVEPIRDMFSVVFFTGIGMHVYPSFVWEELSLIMVLTAFVVGIKYVVCLMVLNRLASPLQRRVISAGLAQVSEFSFVLASRGRRLHFLNREVYLLILSITATSLILSPVIWKISLSFIKRRTHR